MKAGFALTNRPPLPRAIGTSGPALLQALPLSFEQRPNGASRTRTGDLLGAIQEPASANPAPRAGFRPFQSLKPPRIPPLIRGFWGWDALHPKTTDISRGAPTGLWPEQSRRRVPRCDPMSPLPSTAWRMPRGGRRASPCSSRPVIAQTRGRRLCSPRIRTQSGWRRRARACTATARSSTCGRRGGGRRPARGERPATRAPSLLRGPKRSRRVDAPPRGPCFGALRL
jgi:hypothetical protein